MSILSIAHTQTDLIEQHGFQRFFSTDVPQVAPENRPLLTFYLGNYYNRDIDSLGYYGRRNTKICSDITNMVSFQSTTPFKKIIGDIHKETTKKHLFEKVIHDLRAVTKHFAGAWIIATKKLRAAGQ